jgi:glycosyltransferase involved in cell wall biosynthesis
MRPALLKAPLSQYSGWGQDGIGLTMAMLRSGLRPLLLPLEVVPPLPLPVARLLAEPLTPPFALVLAHVAADRCRLASAEQAASSARVLWSMWEWTSFVNHPQVETIREHLRAYDAIVAYDPVSAGAFRALAPPDRPVLQVQGGVDAGAWPTLDRVWEPPIRFLVVGHLTDRKNPAAVLEAFGALLEEHGPRGFDAELHFKLVDRDNPLLGRPAADDDGLLASGLVPPVSHQFVRLAQGRQRVFLHAGTWSRRRLLGLYARMHCLVAPSRGEGKNLAALEFMATGGPVIATDFGGHSVWLDPSYTYPLRYELRPATWPRPTPEALQADADVGHLRELLWRVSADPEEARRKGQLASEVIRSGWAWDTALRRLLAALAEAGIATPPVIGAVRRL